MAYDKANFVRMSSEESQQGLREGFLREQHFQAHEIPQPSIDWACHWRCISNYISDDGIEESRWRPGYLCYLHAMHLVIITYPEHFPDDTPKVPNELHSRENWFRALSTLRFYWKTHKKQAVSRVNSLSRRFGIISLWMDSEVASIDKTMDGNTSYACIKRIHIKIFIK